MRGQTYSGNAEFKGLSLPRQHLPRRRLQKRRRPLGQEVLGKAASLLSSIAAPLSALACNPIVSS